MNPNNSPWITQLRRSRPVNRLTENTLTSVVIVGGGISGITTAYFLLTYTQKKVLLVEAGKVAHGATGHNAGQLTSYFERQISEIAKEFGIEKTAAGQRLVHTAWDLIEEIQKNALIKVPVNQFAGYAGCKDLTELMIHLKNSRIAYDMKVPVEKIKIAAESGLAAQIPTEYNHLYTVVPHAEILELLETADTEYIALMTARKGSTNSALFSEELVGFLLASYPDRFKLAEESPVSEITLYKNSAILTVRDFEVVAQEVVLCTNGFERFTIKNKAGGDIDPKFHYLVRGAIGYMAAYLEESQNPPVAISYLPKSKSGSVSTQNKDSYFYLTRRPFENDQSGESNLISVGGPEAVIDDTNEYKHDHPYPQEAQEKIDMFLRSGGYKHAPRSGIAYKYKWHGLMGYTPNGIRLVGREPLNPILLYNLGCNGIGILPAIYGSKRISQLINNEALEPSIFDPKNIDYKSTQ